MKDKLLDKEDFDKMMGVDNPELTGERDKLDKHK